MSDRWQDQVALLRRRAADLAAPLSAAARGRTTLGQERAILRMFGVDGLDQAGRPLASSVVDSYCAGDRERLAAGVALPFAVALADYDLGPRELAIEVAARAIDLDVESAELDEPAARDAAIRTLHSLAARAAARFDENRTAARELRDVLGDPTHPWLGVTLFAYDAETAEEEARRSVEDGVGLLRVRVPASWELVEAHRAGDTAQPQSAVARQSGSRIRGRHRGEARPAVARDAKELTPAGSQRGLATLRSAADEAAAERGAYAAMMTVTSALAAPEQAVVAAAERVDFVDADPFREIVEATVDAERALADHYFAHRLHVRSGCRVFVGPGPLALGPEIASGVPVGRETLAGRALALQALAVEFGISNGLAPAALLVGAVPKWIAADGDATSVIVQGWLRAAVFPGHGLVLEEPEPVAGTMRSYELTAALAAVACGSAEPVVAGERARSGCLPVLYLRQPIAAAERRIATAELRSSAAAASAIRQSLGSGELRGEAGLLAGRILTAANEVLARFAVEGWPAVLGAAPDADSPRLGGEAVVDRAGGPHLLEMIESGRTTVAP